ncbi:prenyltransferase/squalene oxidase repeat-containing protein [Roseibacillus ishigakijimensis]|uniref:Terpene cyclase/mutase family protein n=1 Tax=Roseibacillus ishigakijimensis TaxID=454146 RepID=A0A934RPV2_9BACT|nr:prenyltransferase/squalene oxidase repeat-containing protein [Roseibacillus ishigakijimensis]MBK1833652.1 terpene cyclase/mutase family protein [Roseibacillus ishigakijimensis]
MSLHAQLSPEAAERLRIQKRNSTLASLLISILSIVLVGLILAFVLMKGINLEQPDIVTYKASASNNDDLEQKEINPSIQRKPSAPSSAMAKVIAANTTSPTAIPVPDVDIPLPSTDFGDGDDFGAGWGSGGDGGGGGFGNIPAEMRKRCSLSDRLQRLAENGGNEQCEEAVMKALRWLKDKQKPDGSWGGQKPVGMTGLALLAYLGHCETPLSEEFGDAVTKAMVYLVDNNMKQNGRSASDLQDKHWCYEHAIAMYALSESYTFCKQLGIENVVPQMKEAVEAGTNWIIDNANDKGGWGYSYYERADSSIVAWHMQALKAASSTGLDFSKMRRTINGGLDFLEATQAKNGGFGYTGKQPVGSANGHFTLTGAGALCFQQHKGVSNSNARKGVGYIEDNATFSFAQRDNNLYEHYYNSQAMINHGGNAWKKYNELVRDELLKSQREDGSWPGNTGPGNHGDPVYSVALATLMLEVYYRFLPGTGSAG